MKYVTYIHLDPLRKIDGRECLCYDFAGQQVRLSGSGCGGLLSGWKADFLYSGFSPILLLQLSHLNGDCAAWYIGPDGSRLGGSVDELDANCKNLLRQKILETLRPSVRSLIENTLPEMQSIVQDFMKLDESIRLDLNGIIQDGLILEPELRTLDGNEEKIPVIVGDSKTQGMINSSHVIAALEKNLQDSLLEVIRNGNVVFSIPGPVNGRESKVTASLCLDDFHFLYRFIESDIGIVFYLIAGHEVLQTYAFYIPECNLLLCTPGQSKTCSALARELPRCIAYHFTRFGLEFLNYLTQPISKMTSMLRASPWTHIGHQLWNELSGTDRLQRELDSRDCVEWIVPDARNQVEFYGPIDQLFPKLQGRVKRKFCDVAEEIRHVYTNNRLAVRFTQDFVSDNLRSRIMSFAALSYPLQEDCRDLLPCEGASVILLGLRTENRTIVNLQSFYTKLISSILREFPETRFVIDGHNVAEGTNSKYKSHGKHPAKASAVVAAERELVHFLRIEYGSQKIIGNVGHAVLGSLQLINQCDFFISLWGAGLAKYRWVCNKPGFVITIHWNLTQRTDLNIYDHPKFLENPTPLYWVDPNFVTDVTDAPRIVKAGAHSQWSNFFLCEEKVINSIQNVLSRYLLSKTSGQHLTKEAC